MRWSGHARTGSVQPRPHLTLQATRNRKRKLSSIRNDSLILYYVAIHPDLKPTLPCFRKAEEKHMVLTAAAQAGPE